MIRRKYKIPYREHTRYYDKRSNAWYGHGSNTLDEDEIDNDDES
jgi:hypothetical protein